ncbi:transcriptional regulator [Aliivibrio fischeri]|uniref:Transcriptional regulator n=1 Tax=Aliivibrio fischeri TaxID=668 RepID=A0A510UI60_ALIFS|nr:S24 family peptidase [Aliivibrio fischeri]MUK92460.1 transcriptional regulator [Aliivibrio fischeri]OCH57560.1 transcriptional regulator [Aliivibrio fischeri]GEK14308.1 transcriptional regulator [Aliivibrio fischeri]
MNNVDEQLIELKKLTNTSKNVDLAKVLGTTASTIQTWRKRGKIPDDIFIKARHISQNGELPTPKGMVSLTYYDVEASAGHGSLVEVEVATEINFAEVFLRDELGVNPKEVFAMKVKGESMYPTLKDGARVIIKRVDDFAGDGIYVFRVNGQIMIKRLQFQPTKITFVSDNNHFYQPWELTHTEIKNIDFEILGQAVWGGGKL